jgi:hypothetical protein
MELVRGTLGTGLPSPRRTHAAGQEEGQHQEAGEDDERAFHARESSYELINDAKTAILLAVMGKSRLHPQGKKKNLNIVPVPLCIKVNSCPRPVTYQRSTASRPFSSSSFVRGSAIPPGPL